MIIFGGWGSLVGLLGAAGIMWFGSLFGDSLRTTGLFALIAGAVLFGFGRLLHETDRALLTDADGQQVVVGQKHHLFWVQIRWWGLAIGLFGLLGLLGLGG